MAKTYETKYGIGLRDEASATIGNIQTKIRDLNKALKDVQIGSQTFNDLKNEIVKSESALKTAKDGIGRYGQEQNRLKDFIREERMEQRQQNFLFNQLKDVTGTAAIGLSTLGMVGGESMKKLSGGLNQGFVAFQGLDFLLKGIPGPWGLAISIVGGVAAAILGFGKETEEATKSIKEQTDEINKLIGVYDTWEKMLKGSAEDNRTVSEAEAVLLRARANLLYQVIDAQKKGEKELNLIIDDRKISRGQLLALETEAGLIVKRTLKENEDALKELERRLRGVEAASMDVAAKLPKAIGGTINWNTTSAGIDKSTVATDKFRKEIRKLLTSELPQIRVEIPAAWREVQVECDKIFNETFNTAKDTLGNVSNAMRVGFEAAFSGAAGAGKTFMKSLLTGFIDMIEGMVIAAEAAALSKAIVSWGATLIADMPKLALAFGVLESARAIIGRLHEGGSIFYDAPPSQEALVKIRGQETLNVQTPEQRFNNTSNITVIVNNYGPVADEEAFKRIVESGLRRTGLEVTEYFRNSRGSLALG